jgi:hypothetical protein
VTVRHPFGAAVLAGDEEAAIATLAEGVVFSSPAVHKPYQGRPAVAALLHVVAEVLEEFRYVDEWQDGTTTILHFRARVTERELEGIDILEADDDGLVGRLTVMVRPLSGLQALAAAVSARLDAA